MRLAVEAGRTYTRVRVLLSQHRHAIIASCSPMTTGKFPWAAIRVLGLHSIIAVLVPLPCDKQATR
jgi:hypothetical protein